MKPNDPQQREPGEQNCTFEGCDNLVVNKKSQLCRNHYWLRRVKKLNLECSTADCKNRVYNKKWLICRYHYGERIAPNHLRVYIERYDSPFSQNRRYFADLASTINWSDVDRGVVTIRKKDVSRYRAFGEQLKVYELPEELTWMSLDEACSQLSKRSNRSTLIRSCLFDLGQLYVERGLLPDWKSYLVERWLRQSLTSTPAIFREHVVAFQQWSLDGMPNPRLQLRLASIDCLSIRPKTLMLRISSVNAFLTWCVAHKVRSLSEVDQSLITDYQDSLFWKWECRSCRNSVPLCRYPLPDKCVNTNCEAIKSYARVRRLFRNTVTGNISHLRVFFTWAQLHGLVTDNPVRQDDLIVKSRRTFTFVDNVGQHIDVAGAIRRYDDWVMKKLCDYIFSADADAEEALILYLVIFHLFTLTELCNVKIPSLVKDGTVRVDSDCTKDYQYLVLPLTKRTRGRLLFQRPTEKIRFPRKAIPWLSLLLKRFYEKRRKLVKARHNEYLLTVPWVRHNKPVSEAYVKGIVGRSSFRVLGATVNISDLRRTAAVIFAKRSKRHGTILTRVGYNDKGATIYNYLDTFSIKPKRTRDRRFEAGFRPSASEGAGAE